METCLETNQLIKWLNGSLDEATAIKIGEHIESCEKCLLRLEELTDVGSVSPPSDPEMLFDRPTFTNEPNFHSMRQKLSKGVSGLSGKSQKPKPTDDGRIQNCLQLSTKDAPETIENAGATLPSRLQPDRQLEPFFEIDGYHIETKIGQGGFAQVFQAWDKRLERNVAIKVLDKARLNSRNRHRFLREAKTASSFESPNVVRVLTSGEAHGRPYIVMELIEGQTLADWVERVSAEQNRDNDGRNFVERGSTLTTAGVELLVQICNGVQAVHDAGLVHRDIKPSNIFIDEKKSIAKLGDFGLARILEQDTVTLTRAAELAGTPAYMSPEQTEVATEADSRSDIYSLGATLYHVITGQAPFRGSSLAILKQVSEVEPIKPSLLNESVELDLETICQKAMSKLPEHRYKSAGALADDLQRFLGGQPIVARPVSALRRLLMWRNRNRVLANTLGMLLLALVAGTAGTTTMWIKSARHANDAQRYATSLEENRTKLRESVSKFQQRVFSEQAMHWQMPEAFRSKMFADVISYLDEFAELESPVNSDAAQIRQLNSDYLLVAQAALDVYRYEDARLASDRTLERLDRVSTGETQHAYSFVQHCRAAKIGYFARSPVSRFFNLATESDESTKSERKELALKYQAAVAKVDKESLSDSIRRLWELEADFLVFSSEVEPTKDALFKARMRYEEMVAKLNRETDHEIRIEIIETALRTGWVLSEKCSTQNAIEIIRQNTSLVESLRESLRRLSKSLTDSDWLKAKNHARLAVLLHSEGDVKGAIKSAQEAEHAFRKGVLLRPQNRIWTEGMICLQLLLSDWLNDEGELSVAVQTLTDAVMHNIRLAKSYPDDIEIQKRTIKIFVKRGDTGAKLKSHAVASRDFYIGARDCQLIGLKEEHREWAFESRLWLVSRALEQLDFEPNEETLAGITENEHRMVEGWRKSFDLDTTLMQAVIDREHQPERPHYFESSQITQDFLEGN